MKPIIEAELRGRTHIRQALTDMPKKFDPPTVGYLRHNGIDVGRLRLMGLNESVFPPSARALDAMRAGLEQVNRYPDAQCPALTDRVALATGIAADCIVWGNGTEELIRGTIDLAVVRGESVVINVPTFWGYRAMLRAAEARAIFVPVLDDGRPDVPGMIAGICGDTSLVCLVTPNNPTGSMTSESDLRSLAAGVPEDVVLMVDEAYHEFARFAGGADVLSVLRNRRGPWVVLRSFSKAYSMAGMRIGYALCSDDALADALRKTTCVFNVPMLAQLAAEAMFEDREYLDPLLGFYARARDSFAAGLKALGLEPLPSVANFVSVELPGLSNKHVLDALMARHIQVHAWPDPGYESFIRVTIGQDDDNAACLAALGEILNPLGR